MVRLTISENEAGQRLDRFLRKYLKRATLGFIYKTIRKDVKLNGRRVGGDVMLSDGDILTLYIPEEKLSELTADMVRKTAKKRFGVAYEDENILIADKPAGLLTHGDSREKKNTLANQVCGYLQEKGEYDPSSERTFAPSPVNRLDRNTTGLVIFGKNAAALRTLTRLIRERGYVEKYYMTIVCGPLREPLRLESGLEKDEVKNISRVTGGERGKAAVTYVEPIFAGKDFSLVEVRIPTGRTHQIRVHLAESGFPLTGDPKYGDPSVNARLKKLGITTQLLHAYKLEFNVTEDEYEGLAGLTVEAGAPAGFVKAARTLIPDYEWR